SFSSLGPSVLLKQPPLTHNAVQMEIVTDLIQAWCSIASAGVFEAVKDRCVTIVVLTNATSMSFSTPPAPLGFALFSCRGSSPIFWIIATQCAFCDGPCADNRAASGV